MDPVKRHAVPSLLRPVAIRSAAEEVALQISGLVKDGHLKPGDQLPSEAELAKSLDVARSTVREAKRSLVAQGIIELHGKRGAFVSPRAMDHSAIASAIEMLAAGVATDLYETRRAVEVAAAGLAAVRRTEQDLRDLERLLGEVEREWRRHSTWSAGLGFHVAIVEASHNQVMIAVYRLIAQLIQHNHGPYYRTITDGDEEIRSHRLLLEAVRGGDPNAAAAAMRGHIDDVEARRQRAVRGEMG